MMIQMWLIFSNWVRNCQLDSNWTYEFNNIPDLNHLDSSNQWCFFCVFFCRLVWFNAKTHHISMGSKKGRWTWKCESSDQLSPRLVGLVIGDESWYYPVKFRHYYISHFFKRSLHQPTSISWFMLHFECFFLFHETLAHLGCDLYRLSTGIKKFEGSRAV